MILCDSQECKSKHKCYNHIENHIFDEVGDGKTIDFGQYSTKYYDYSGGELILEFCPEFRELDDLREIDYYI